MHFSKSVTNMALKLKCSSYFLFTCFGTIRNNTALKLDHFKAVLRLSFGTIRNNTALKPRGPIFVSTFRNRAIHLSQISASK